MNNSAILAADRRASGKLRQKTRMDMALEAIREYTGSHHSGRAILSWRPDGQVEIEFTERWHPPQAIR